VPTDSRAGQLASAPTSSTSLVSSPRTTASIPIRPFPISACRSDLRAPRSSLRASFNDDTLAHHQAICDYRAAAGTDGRCSSP